MQKKNRVTIGYVLRTFVLPRKKIILFGLFLIIVSRLSGLVVPWSGKFLIDEVIAKNNFELLKIFLLGIVASIMINAITSYMLTRILSVEAQHLISILRVKVQQHILR